MLYPGKIVLFVFACFFKRAFSEDSSDYKFSINGRIILIEIFIDPVHIGLVGANDIVKHRSIVESFNMDLNTLIEYLVLIIRE